MESDNLNNESENLIVDVEGEGLRGGPVGSEARFLAKTSVWKGKPCKAGLLVAFDGPSEPEIEFEHFDNGDTMVIYTPQVPGIYLLTVKYNETPCKGSPWKIHISGRGAPITRPNVVKRNIVKKVKLSGTGLEQGKVNTPNEIIVDIKTAEINCELEVNVLSSPKPIISVVEKSPGIISLGYTPTAKGTLQMTLKFRGEHVKGSPLSIPIVN